LIERLFFAGNFEAPTLFGIKKAPEESPLNARLVVILRN
jgi:hypothetical protein